MESENIVKCVLKQVLKSTGEYQVLQVLFVDFKSGLAQGVNKGLSKPGDSSKFPPLKTCRAHLVSQDGIAKIDQLAEKLRPQDFGASTRKYFGKIPTTPVLWLRVFKYY